MPGINELVDEAEQRIGNGIEGLRGAAGAARRSATDARGARRVRQHKRRSRLCAAAEALHAPIRRCDRRRASIKAAVDDTIPNVPVLFWAFRIMVGLRHLLHRAVRRSSFWLGIEAPARTPRWYPEGRAAVACRCRGSRPSWAGSSPSTAASRGRSKACCRRSSPFRSISAGNVLITLIGFVVFYSTLAIVDVYLMLKAIRTGPATEDEIDPLPPFTRLAAAE